MKKILLILLFLFLLSVTGGALYYASYTENKLNEMRAERDALSIDVEEFSKRSAVIADEEISGDLLLASILVEDSYERVRKVKMVFRNFDYNDGRTGYEGEYWLLLVDADGKVLDQNNLTEFKMFFSPLDLEEDSSVLQKSFWSFDKANRKVGLYYGPDESGIWATAGKSLLWVMFDNHFFPRPVFIEDDKLVFYQ